MIRSWLSWSIPTYLLSGLVVLAGCDAGPSEANRRAQNLLRFDYSGARSGSYQAHGAAPADRSISGSFAVGYTRQEDVIVSSFSTTTPPRGHRAVLEVGLRGGTHPFACPDPVPVYQCAGMTIIFNRDPAASGTREGEEAITLETGSLTITEVTPSVVRGTFSGAGTLWSAGREVGSLQISGGVFDIEIKGPL